MKLSGKDILIVIGIAVAIVVCVTVVFYQEKQETTRTAPEVKKTSLNQVAAETISRFVKRAKY